MERDTNKRLKRIPINDSSRKTYAVVGGLLVRQHELATSIVRDSLTWNHTVAPLIHRSMAEVRITLGYILLENTEDRCESYIQYGLGQEKLQIEHYESEMATGDHAPALPQIVESRKAWLSIQQHAWITSVDLGAQFARPIRAIAIDADLKDLYDFNYSPFSAAIHSTWQHIGKHCVAICQEPLHGFHLIPAMGEDISHPCEAAVAVKNFDYTLKAVDRWLGKKLKGEARLHFERYLPLHQLIDHTQKQAAEVEL